MFIPEYRIFDPEALRQYQSFLQGLLDELEQEIVPSLRDGTLKKAPAFGSAPGAHENAGAAYAEFHATTWRNLQYLRGTLYGMIAELETAIETGEETDERVARTMTSAPDSDIYS